MPRRRRRRPRWIWAAAGLAIVAAVAVALWWRRAPRAAEVPEADVPAVVEPAPPAAPPHEAPHEVIPDRDRRALRDLIERKSGRE